jgi:hypothetical protein
VAQTQEPDRGLTNRLDRLEQHVQNLTKAVEQEMQRMNRPEGPRGPMPPPAVCPGPSPAAMRCLKCAGHALLAVLATLHILLAIWVYGDVRKRNVEGRAIFIALVLLCGIPMSILYALVRIGDKVGEKSS